MNINTNLHFVGVEALYEEEHETEIDLERWSIQAGPNVQNPMMICT